MSAVGEHEAVKADGQAGLVAPADSLGGADEAAAAGNEHALPVGRVEGNRDDGQDRSGKFSGQLVDQDGLEERALVHPLPAGRVVGGDEAGRGFVVGEESGIGQRNIQRPRLWSAAGEGCGARCERPQKSGRVVGESPGGGGLSLSSLWPRWSGPGRSVRGGLRGGT